MEALVNGKSIGRTGALPSTSAMQRDGIRAYWVERVIRFDAARLQPGSNQLQLLSHAQVLGSRGDVRLSPLGMGGKNRSRLKR